MSAPADLAFAPVHVLSPEVGAGRLSPVDLVEALLARIEKHDPKLHAFIAVYGADARLAAEAAHKAIKSGHRVGPFHGIPVALKDLIEIEGRVTTGGCKVWQNRISLETATLAERLIAAGAIVLGKTHTVEFALGGWGTNQHMGTPWNPWDRKTHRTPGGSSSGSGVAVAAGLAPWALGTDTGGSVRLPSSWCGLAGLKTTIGRISTHGILPLSSTLDTPGPMARSVEDAALLYRLLAGPDARDPKTLLRPPEDPLPTLKRGVAGLRLGQLPAADRAVVAPEVLAAYDQSLRVFESLGAKIVDVALPRKLEDFAPLTARIMNAEAYHFDGELAERPELPLDEAVRPRVLAGRTLSARDYLRTLQEREAAKAGIAPLWAGIDALLTPTTATAAIPLDAVDQNGTPGVFTRAVNFLDLCALALPNGATADGLPTSLQVVCQGYGEATALRIGWAFEQATDWHKRRPPEA